MIPGIKKMFLFTIFSLITSCTVTQREIEDITKYSKLRFNDSLTCSMCPTITKDSVAYLIDDVDKNNIKVGEIISFRVPYNKMIDGEYYKEKNVPNRLVHRVIKIKQDKEGLYYITKGDNNLFSDYFLWQGIKVRPNMIEGVVIQEKEVKWN